MRRRSKLRPDGRRKLARARELFGYLRHEPARGIRGDEPAKEPRAGVLVPPLTESGEGVERETSGLPQRVVAVAARRMVRDDRFVRRHDCADVGQHGRRRIVGRERHTHRLFPRKCLGVHHPRRRRGVNGCDDGELSAKPAESAKQAFLCLLCERCVQQPVCSFDHGEPVLIGAARRFRRSSACRRAPRGVSHRWPATRGPPSPSCRPGAPPG